MTDTDILRPLSAVELDELLQLYQEKYGNENFHYLLIYNQLKWDNKILSFATVADNTNYRRFSDNANNSDNNNKNNNNTEWKLLRKIFYTHREYDFRQYGTYISIHNTLVQNVSFHSWQPGYVHMLEALTETKRIEWNNSPLLINVQPEYSDAVKRIALSKGIPIKRSRKCIGFIMTNEEARNLNVPATPTGYNLGTLEPNNAEFIHSHWPNSAEGSVEYLCALMRFNRTLGVYRKADDKLIAWIFQNDFAGVGILQVVPEMQRQGFGLLLTLAMSKIIALDEPTALTVWIVAENKRSRALLEKIGYKSSVLHEWITL